MTTQPKLVPTASQTVGPFFRIGLDYLIDHAPSVESATRSDIELHGRVLERDGAPVHDAMLEFWSAGIAVNSSVADANDCSPGFRRVATDLSGSFSVTIPRPAPVPFYGGKMQSPHMLVLVFARGLLRHLISRVYLSDEAGNVSDPVLLEVPPERRHTLIAQSQPGRDRCFHWDVVLQGPKETVFFAW